MTEPIRSDEDPMEWARQLVRIANREPPTKPLLISHFDHWEIEMFNTQATTDDLVHQTDRCMQCGTSMGQKGVVREACHDLLRDQLRARGDDCACGDDD